ncbi:hypothetical protein N2152v2_006928 [Parachlorella kessleri]
MAEGPDEFPKQPCSAPFLQLDTSFTCAVCHGLFDTPLLVKSCGHSFCSACIRQNLEFQERRGLGSVCCPSCRKPCDARDLLLNVALRDAADKYRSCRATLVRLLHDSVEQQRRQERQQSQQQQAAKHGKEGRPKKRLPAQPLTASQRQVASSPRKLRPRPQQQQPSSAARGSSKLPGNASTGKRAASGPKRSHQQQQQQGPSRQRQRSSRQLSGAALSQGSGSDSGWGEGGSSDEDGGQPGEDPQRRASLESDFAVDVEDASSSSSSDGEGTARRGSGRACSSGPSQGKTRSKASLMGTAEAIDLLDLDSDDDFQHGGGFSDAESLSPPAKRARRAKQQQRGTQGAGKRPVAAPAAELWNGRRQEQKEEGGAGGGGKAGPAQVGDDREAGGDEVAQEAPPKTPQGFVRCPVCNKTVPGFYINSHVDDCLKGGGAATQPTQPTGKQRPQQQQQPQPLVGKPSGGLRGGAAAAGAAANGVTAPAQRHKGQPPSGAAAAAADPLAGLHPRQQGHPQQQQEEEEFVPLLVPAKLVPSLVTDKTLRGFLQKYGLPTDGKKKDMMERYNALRLAVETANDRHERVTYQQLSSRVVRQERQRASAGAAGVLGSVAGALLRKQAPAGSAGGPTASGPVAKRAADGRSKSPVDSGESHTFKALEAALRARMVAKKAAAAAAQAAVPVQVLAAVGEGAKGGEAGGSCPEQQQEQQAEGQQEGQVQATVSAPVLSQADRPGDELEQGSSQEPRRGQSLPPGLPCGTHTAGDPSPAVDLAALPPQHAFHEPQGTSAVTAAEPVQQQQGPEALPNAASLLRHGAPHGGSSQHARQQPSPARDPPDILLPQHQQPHPHQPRQQYGDEHWKEQQPPNSAPYDVQALPLQPQHCQQGSHVQRGAPGYHPQAPAVVLAGAGPCRMQAAQRLPHQQQSLPGAQQPAQQGAAGGGLDHPMLSMVYDVLDVADSGDESW